MSLKTCAALLLSASLFLLVIGLVSVAVASQCVDSSEVTGFKVRSVKFKTLFGAVPSELRKQLDGHVSEAYSSDRASAYLREIQQFYSTDPLQAKYEQLIANKLRLSVKAGKTWLDCVEKIDPLECQKSLPGTAQCVDVTIRRYFVDIDALDSSPYFLLFPRSALAVLYGAIPRSLLALNPSLGANQEKGFGPAASVDTATDLFDLNSIFNEESGLSSGQTIQATTSPSAIPADSDRNLEVTLGAPATHGSEEPQVQLDKTDTKLLFGLKLRKALTKDFYDTSTSLNFVRTSALDVFQNLALEAKFDAHNLPHGDGRVLSNALAVGLRAQLRTKQSAARIINLEGNYRWSRNRFSTFNDTLPSENDSENGYAVRAVFDGSLARGLARGAMWFDGGSLKDRGRSYRRLAALVGYGKDFVLPKKKDFHQISPPELSEPCWTSIPDPKDPEQTIKNASTVGFEILAGIGRSWGDTPEYVHFYGGSAPGDFLYDELQSAGIRNFPAGPIIRSIGQGKAGLIVAPGVTAGGTSYWHANANLSIPIPAWTRPLIPHEWVTLSSIRKGDEEFRGRIPEGAKICRDLKDTVKTLVGVSGVNLMVNQQARDLLTPAQKNDLRLRNKDPRTPDEERRLRDAEQRLEEAKKEVRPRIEAMFNQEILPVTNFIADYANSFAIKPLFMFDTAHLSLDRVGKSRTSYAIGGGLQIDIVLARFDLGYLATLKRVPGSSSGSFIARLVLRRFF